MCGCSRRGGVISLPELRQSGFATPLNSMGRLETEIEESEYFSLARHERIQEDYFSLRHGGRS
ncbi:unnamed protein product, partial [Laminaria digitata]